MELEALLNDRSIKAKDKSLQISSWLLEGILPLESLVHFASQAQGTSKAICLEGIEYMTRKNPEIAQENLWDFATQCLADQPPAVKRESARIVGNIAFLFPTKLEKTISTLLENTKHTGTVVRWSAAFALGEIIKMNTPFNKQLHQQVNVILKSEEQNSIRKIYLDAIKKSRTPS